MPPQLPARREEVVANMTEKKMQRYSISVSAGTYDHLRTVVTGSLAAFVDKIVVTALDDPSILARVVARCHPRQPRKEAET